MAAQWCQIPALEWGKTWENIGPRGKQGCELHLTEERVLFFFVSFLFTATTPAELWIFPAAGQDNAETSIQARLPRDST